MNWLVRNVRRGLVGLVLLYGIGLGLFAANLPQPFTVVPPEVQGVGVFTGGSGRVAGALRLVDEGFAGPVLISGRNPKSSLADMLELTPGAPDLTPAQQAQFTLDEAESTRGNVLALKTWAEREELGRVGVITSTYHVLRVRLLAWWLAPELSIVMLPVQPEVANARTLVREYHKLLVGLWLK